MSDQDERRALVATRNAKRSQGLAIVSLVAGVAAMIYLGKILFAPLLAVAWFGYRGWVEPR